MKKPLVSVVIVTKNRAADLVQCVESLCIQKTAPDEIVIIDNASTDETHDICMLLRKRCKIPFRYVIESHTGYPVIYNRGIQEASYNWVAFIDDDCIADRSWMNVIKQSLQNSSHIDVLLGRTLPYVATNPYSLATHVFQDEWKMNHIRGKHINNYEILDNKNIVYNRIFLKMHSLQYDESRVTYLSGAAEDCDLGRQIQSKKGNAVYAARMTVYHKNATTMQSYWRRTILSLAAYKHYREKWPTVDNDNPSSKRIKLRALVVTSIRENDYHGYKALLFIIIVYCTVLFSVVIDTITRRSPARQIFIRLAHRYFFISK